jgi:hypothetical protein
MLEQQKSANRVKSGSKEGPKKQLNPQAMQQYITAQLYASN